MKNQYFGDINDYRKYGLVRALQSSGRGSLLVAWMLTPDDGGTDGQIRSYLKQPKLWSSHDLPLFTGLDDLLRSAPHPSVSMIERSELLAGATYHSAMVPDGRQERDAWFHDLLRAAAGVDLVFLDPDNGIEVPSKPIGRKDSSKYVFWHEIQQLWELGCSVLIYQHFVRKERSAFAQRLLTDLRDRTASPFVAAFRTPHVLFLLAAQHRHAKSLRGVVPMLLDRWGSQMEAIGVECPGHLPE